MVWWKRGKGSSLYPPPFSSSLKKVPEQPPRVHQAHLELSWENLEGSAGLSEETPAPVPGKVGAEDQHCTHCSKTWKTHPQVEFFLNKTLRAPQPQHKELSRELWALMKRACLNYPTAPGINPSNLQPWSHCSSSSNLQNLGSFRGRLLGFFFSPPNKHKEEGVKDHIQIALLQHRFLYPWKPEQDDA